LDKICVFSHKTFIPPTSGHNVASFNTLTGLVKEGVIVDFHTYGQKNMAFQHNGVNVHIYPFPRLAKLLFQNKFFKRLMEHAKSYEAYLCLSALTPHFVSFASKGIVESDLVFVEHIWCSFFPLLYAKFFRKPVVVVDRNVETLLSRRFLKKATPKLTKLLLFLRLTYTFLLEKFSCSLATRVFVRSQNDKLMLNTFLGVPLQKVEIFPPSVDTSRMKNNPRLAMLLRKRLQIPSQALVVCFLGDLTTVPNYLSAKYIVEHIARKVLAAQPEIYFLIIGRYRKIPSYFLENPRVIFTNEVLDLTPFLSSADICIAPLTLGSGVKLKILTYFSFGKPVISTPIGMEGIEAKNGEKAIICGLGDFTKEILKLALDPESRSTLGRRGRKFVEEHYDRGLITKRLITTLKEVAY